MTTSSRYEVGFEGVESVDHASTFAEARELACLCEERARRQAHAVKKANREATVYIYDRMAHIGKAELWHVVGGDLRVVRVRAEKE